MFKPGNPGRPKGSKNKILNVRELLNEMEIDPFREWIACIRNLDSVKLEAEHWREICKFIQPQLKAVEYTGEINGNVTLEPLVRIVLPSNGRELEGKAVQVATVLPIATVPVESPSLHPVNNSSLHVENSSSLRVEHTHNPPALSSVPESLATPTKPPKA